MSIVDFQINNFGETMEAQDQVSFQEVIGAA